ncbi:MAG TPA: GNAT family N-acetyltransferase [Erysipelothrix sp.]
MTKSKFIVKENMLTAEIYELMHHAAGFKSYELDDVRVALANDLYDVVVYHEDQAVAIARLVGDGRIVFFLKDVIVHPKYQNQGCGSLMMDAIFNYLEEHACDGAYVGLMSTPGNESFYSQYGFITRPTDVLGSGMVLFYER